MAKLVVFAAMLLILASLGSGLFFLMKDTVGSRRTVRALTVRITLSLGLFAFLIAAFAMGWLHPHPLILN